MMLPDPQVLLGGLFLGALYGLSAMGFQLILGTTGQVYLAFGHLWMMAALMLPGLMDAVPLPAVLIVCGLGLAGAAAGWLFHPGALWKRAVSSDKGRAFFIITLGLAMILEDAGSRIWPLPGTALTRAPSPVNWGGVTIPPVKAGVLLLALAVAMALTLFFRYHRLGWALRAWDRGTGAVDLVGISRVRLGKTAMAAALGVAGLAGGLLALSYTASIQEGMAMTLRCLVIGVAAGTLSPWRVMAMGLGLGAAEAWISQIAGAQWSPLAGYLLLMTVLPVRERGRS